jgi:hypothetical protein
VVSPARFRLLSLSAVAILAVVLAACAGTRFGGGAPSADAVASSEPSQAASTAPSTAPSAEPSADLGPFSCDFPIERRGTPVHSRIVDVRVGQHDGYDRVVFEFDGDVPEYLLSGATPPYTEDPSGLPIDVEGRSVWQLVMLGGTRFDDDYEPTYESPLSFKPDFDKLVHLVEAGDFEATSTWYIGLSGKACARVLLLDEPSRLVIDIEH